MLGSIQDPKGLGITATFVGMVLKRQLAIILFDLLEINGVWQESFVVVPRLF